MVDVSFENNVKLTHGQVRYRIEADLVLFEDSCQIPACLAEPEHDPVAAWSRP